MITLAIFWALWATVTAGIMLVDRILSDDTFGAPLSSYFVLAAITPFMVLPVYFFSSHRSDAAANRWGLTIAGLPLTVLAFTVACWQFIPVANIIQFALL
jgi:hypothetical protein